jgi:hypothetical protein
MAMEGDRRTIQNPTSKPESGNRRIDARHSHGNVPILFRLKNLQRVNASGLENGAPPTKFDNETARQSSGSLEPKRTENSVPVSHANRSDAKMKTDGASVASASSPAAAAKTDPVTSPGKHGVSNGVIFLVALVAIAFSIGKKMGSSHATRPASSNSVATAPTTTAASTVASVESTTAKEETPSIATPEPLVVPTLPTLAKEETPDSTESSTADTPNFTSTKTEEGLLTLDMGSPSTEKDDTQQSNDESFSVPLTLASDVKAENTWDKNSSAIGLETNSTDGTSDQTSTTTTMSVPTTAGNANAPVSTVLTTTTPNTDLESMFQIRANYQSQAAAMAKMRQAPPTVSPQNNVAGYQPTYQSSNNLVPSSNQPNPQTGTVPALPVGYGGQERLAPPTNQNFSMSNATPSNSTMYSGPVAPMPGYSQYQPQYPTGTQSQPAAYAQSTNQPYAPSFKQPDPNPTNTTGGFTVPPRPAPYVPIGNQFNPEGYSN